MRKFEQINGNDRKMTITSERRAYIYECAMQNEGPDGTFSDEECLLWEMWMTIRAMSYAESRLEHFKATREKRKKTLNWWKYQKPGKQYSQLTIRRMCSELESEISYLDDVIAMLEKMEVKL